MKSCVPILFCQMYFQSLDKFFCAIEISFSCELEQFLYGVTKSILVHLIDFGQTEYRLCVSLQCLFGNRSSANIIL